MNDPQYVEAARALATRAFRAELETDRERAALMYRLCTARKPSEATVNELVLLFEDQLRKYEQDATAAKQILSGLNESSEPKGLNESRRAAWTIVANLILNLDEVLTKN